MANVRRVAFVTGFTSGIGYATTQNLVRQGIAVFGVARSTENVTAVVKDLREEGFTIDGAAGDVTSVADVRDAVDRAVRTFGPITILVNNAGRNGGGETATLDDEVWDGVIATNLTSVFRVTR